MNINFVTISNINNFAKQSYMSQNMKNQNTYSPYNTGTDVRINPFEDPSMNITGDTSLSKVWHKHHHLLKLL